MDRIENRALAAVKRVIGGKLLKQVVKIENTGDLQLLSCSERDVDVNVTAAAVRCGQSPPGKAERIIITQCWPVAVVMGKVYLMENVLNNNKRVHRVGAPEGKDTASFDGNWSKLTLEHCSETHLHPDQNFH